MVSKLSQQNQREKEKWQRCVIRKVKVVAPSPFYYRKYHLFVMQLALLF
jgi:hypothetical protein